jgi:hypothetical protein
MPLLRRCHPLRVVFVFALLLAFSACAYDSNWGRLKAAQQRFAQQSTPEPIAASPRNNADANDAGFSVVRRAVHVRLRPNGHFLAQTVDAPRQLDRLIDDANRVLTATVGVHLEVDATRPWAFDADDDLPHALDALRREDAADDVDVVIGLVGALPRLTDSLHELGYAELLGKHAVVRAANRFGEHEIFDRQLSELSSEQRDKLVLARKRHRALAVLLHELGHTFGAPHETSPTSLMHPMYDSKRDEFGPGAVALMRIAMESRDPRAAVGAQLEYLRGANPDDWASGEREEAMANLQAISAPHARKLDSNVQAPPSGPPSELNPADRDRFDQAYAMFRAGAVAPAYETAKGLFTAYPNALAVQDLRCQLATVRWLDRSAMVEECAPYSKLAASRVLP